MHEREHPDAGKVVELGSDIDHPRLGNIGRQYVVVVDWWDRYQGASWQKSFGRIEALQYALRSGAKPLPEDDEVVLIYFASNSNLTYLVHDSEIRKKAPVYATSKEFC